MNSSLALTRVSRADTDHLFRTDWFLEMFMKQHAILVQPNFHVQDWKFTLWVSGGDVVFPDNIVTTFIGYSSKFLTGYLLIILIIILLNNLVNVVDVT